MAEIIPAILAKSREELVGKIIIVEPYVERVHLDIADGIAVPNVTISGPEEIETVETRLALGVHLMVSKPENHIHRWLETQADKFVFHIEYTQTPQMIIDAVKEAERSVGIALNPATLAAKIEPFIDQIDFVHFMTVEPGFYGGKFVESVLDKISDFHYFYPDKPIEVDGGVTPETAPRLIEAGVSGLVVGSYIFQNHDVAKAIENLKLAISNKQ